VAALLVGGLSGCAFMTPQATTVQYDASDGINATVGEIEVRNALLVTADGTSASLLVNLDNTSAYGLQVKLQYEDATGTKVDDSVYVNGGSVASFGAAEAQQIILTGLDAPAGSLLPIFVQYGDTTGKQLLVPVLADQGDYAGLAPTAAP
jgi:hypothetical protein